MRAEQMGQMPPRIGPVPDGVPRPLWSVMIPAYNCAKYLQQTLESVLVQAPAPEQMQIEVVDDCSTKDDPEEVVRNVGQGRVVFHRKPRNEGAIANFNTCIHRSRGQLLHILHGDDYVLPGFYAHLGELAVRHSQCALYATRAFLVDEQGVILGVTARLRELEGGSQVTDSFFYGTRIQTPGVVVRREFYEGHGGFHPALVHTADCEMWARATALAGGLVSPEVLACYRFFAANDSSRLMRTADNLRDIVRLNDLFAERYPSFDRHKALYRVCDLALEQIERFSRSQDWEAVQANRKFWRTNAPWSLRAHRSLGRMVRRVSGGRADRS